MKKMKNIPSETLSKDEEIQRLRMLLENTQRSYESQIATLTSSFEARMQREKMEHVAQMDKLNQELEKLIEQIHRASATRFGSKSEKINPWQMSLFNDMEAAFEKGNHEPELESEQKPKKARRKPHHINTSSMPVVIIEHELTGEDAHCAECGHELKDIRTQIRRVVKLIPAHFEVEEHHMHVYMCPTCSKENAEGEEVATTFRQAKMPTLPLEKSWAHPSLIASVINSKYVNAMPLYRIQSDLKSIDHNMDVSRQCLAGWVIKSYQRWLALIYEKLKTELLKGNFLHFDETPILVLKEPDRTPKQKSYMWVMASPKGELPIHVFNYRASRAKSVPQALLEGWHGTIMTDCYAAYFSLENVSNLACLVHIRREFVKVVQGIKEEDLAKAKSYAQKAINMISAMFHVDGKFDDMEPDARKVARNEKLRPLFIEFRDWLYAHKNEVVPKSQLDKAFGNAIKHWPDVMRILEDGRFPLDNNLAERAIRPFCVGRKNWEFSDTPNGAEASAGIYSLVSTSRANGLVPRCYIEWLLTELPNAKDLSDAVLDKFMPWSSDVPAWVKASANAPRVTPDAPIVDVDPHLLDEEPEEVS